MLQGRLKEMGFAPGLIAGDAGPLTERAVRSLQRHSGTAVDGFVGPQTSALLSAPAAARTDAKRQASLPEDAAFICYRRENAADVAGRTYDRLCAQYGRRVVFKDVDSIPIGVNFKNHLSERLSRCHVLPAVVGTRWLSPGAVQGESRLHDPTDFLRIGVERTLRRGIRIVPVFVHGSTMSRVRDLTPELSGFASCQGTSIRPDPDFPRDMNLLIRGLNLIFAEDRHGNPEMSEQEGGTVRGWSRRDSPPPVVALRGGTAASPAAGGQAPAPLLTRALPQVGA